MGAVECSYSQELAAGVGDNTACFGLHPTSASEIVVVLAVQG